MPGHARPVPALPPDAPNILSSTSSTFNVFALYQSPVLKLNLTSAVSLSSWLIRNAEISMVPNQAPRFKPSRVLWLERVCGKRILKNYRTYFSLNFDVVSIAKLRHDSSYALSNAFVRQESARAYFMWHFLSPTKSAKIFSLTCNIYADFLDRLGSVDSERPARFAVILVVEDLFLWTEQEIRIIVLGSRGFIFTRTA